MVDDDLALRVLFEMYLESFGYDPLVAADGDAALRLAAEHPEIQVIMLDIVMSGISGSELSMQLTTLLPEVTILYCSGHPLEALVRLGIEVPASRFIQKPCRPEVWKQRLNELFALRWRRRSKAKTASPQLTPSAPARILCGS